MLAASECKFKFIYVFVCMKSLFLSQYVNGDDEEDIGSQDIMDISVIILMFPNPTFSGNMVTCKASANV